MYPTGSFAPSVPALPVSAVVVGQANDLAAAQAGDPRALDRLLRTHRRAIERICRRMCPARDSFEDLRQDVFIALLRALPGYRGQASFLTWAYTIVRTCRGRRLRKQSMNEALSPIAGVVDLDEYESARDCFASHELMERLDRALSGLTELDHRVLMMRDLEGRSAKEVADATGLTVPAVKTRLHRARVIVRAQLGSDA